ncbi:phosphoribosyltransferase family protein [Deferribacter thermophilus]|uniref:ComF family protein n=1 Tax=Deferribacter thermophilus TaxID=53573 RepID=UPI003C133939
MRKFLKYVKFHYGIKYGHIFNFLLKRILFTHNYDLITPVPAHFIRNFRRFVQPAYIIAKILAKNNNMKYEQVLKRVKKTDYQWKFKKKERGKNIKGAFCLDSDVKGLKILLVDDIITTGSTINECSKVLKENGSKKVDVFCLAKGKFI